MNEQRLQSLQEQIKKYKHLTDRLRREDSHKFDTKELNFYIFKGIMLCEHLLCYLLEQEGYSVNYQRGTVTPKYEASNEIHVFDFCIQKKGLLPDECCKLTSLIRNYNNEQLYKTNITYEIAVSFFDAVDSFMRWFDKHTNEELKISKILGVSSLALGAAVLPLFPLGALGIAAATFGGAIAGVFDTHSKPKYSKKKAVRENELLLQNENDVQYADEVDVVKTVKFDLNAVGDKPKEKRIDKTEKQPLHNSDKVSLAQKENVIKEKGQDILDKEELGKKIDELTLLFKKHDQETKEGFDKISSQIEELSGQINAYQSLVERQLKKAENEREKDRLISAFTDECVERIAKKVRANTDEKIIEIETKMLILTLGEKCWTKLEENSKNYLISAKVIFSKLLVLPGIVDYSGVCLSITKALEVELYKRFYTNYLKFLDERYGKDYTKYPTALLNKLWLPSKSWTILRPENFTLGTNAYVLCYKIKPKEPPQRIENNKARLLEYAKERLLSSCSEDVIGEKLTSYAKAIEFIREEYRNKSSHRDLILQRQAKDCMNYIIDVEKLLKQMLDTFDE